MLRESELNIVCDEKPCHRPALYIVHVHSCTNELRDTYGDVSYFLCHNCCAATLQKMVEMLGKLDFDAQCPTCETAFTSLHDIITCEKLLGSHHAEIGT